MLKYVVCFAYHRSFFLSVVPHSINVYGFATYTDTRMEASAVSFMLDVVTRIFSKLPFLLYVIDDKQHTTQHPYLTFSLIHSTWQKLTVAAYLIRSRLEWDQDHRDTVEKELSEKLEPRRDFTWERHIWRPAHYRRIQG